MLMVDIAYMIEGENSAPVLFTGYGGGAGQGGRVFDQDGEQLKVTANTKNPLYLTGSVYSVYTEKGWQASPQSKGQADFENNSVAYALNQSLYADMSDSLTSSSLITVEYRLIKTRDFFHELNTTNLYFGGKTPEFKNKDPWKMKKAMGKDFKYQLRFLEINENSDEIKELMRGKAWKQNALRAYSQQESEAEIYKACTALPDTVPKEFTI